MSALHQPCNNIPPFKSLSFLEAHDCADEFFLNPNVTWSDLAQLVTAFHQSIAGKYGASELQDVVLPPLQTIFGSNIRKAGTKVVHLIFQSSSRSPKEIGPFYAQAVQDWMTRPAPYTQDQIIWSTNRCLIEADTLRQKVIGDRCNVVAIGLFGSYFNGKPRFDSDLDYIPFTRQQSVADIGFVQGLLENAFRELSLSPFDVKWIGAPDLARDLTQGLCDGKFLIITPWEHVRRDIEKVMGW